MKTGAWILRTRRKQCLKLEENEMEKKIFAWEPVFFLFFGLFHLHRIWGMIDRKTYADFWLGILENRGVFYFILMGLLAILCIAGVIIFLETGAVITGGDGSICLAAVMYCSIYLQLQLDWIFGMNSCYGCLM